MAGHGDGEQAHRGEHRESAAYIVFDHKSLVALRCGQGAQGAAAGVGDGHDELSGGLATGLGLKLLLEQAEGDGGLGGGAALGDDDDAEAAAAQILLQLVEVVLADILTGKEHFGAVGLAKLAAESLQHSLGAQIAAADADAYHRIAVAAQSLGGGVDVGYELGGGVGGKTEPAQEVIAGAVAVDKSAEGLLSLGAERIDGVAAYGGLGVLYTELYLFHSFDGDI